MEKLISISEKCTSDDEETAIDEKKFVEYMRECPIWTYFKMSHANYVSKPHHEKAQLIATYYKAMSKGNKDIFFLFVCLFVFVCCLNFETIYFLIRAFAE